ncbi:hypothetical protein Hanom_Chr07g00632681 [Helianthus anomalus]
MVPIPYTHGKDHTIFLLRHGAYVSKRIQKCVKVAPKMLLQKRRTTRVSSIIGRHVDLRHNWGQANSCSTNSPAWANNGAPRVPLF